MLSGESVELLMHVELGVPGAPGASEGQHLCRLAVRSTSPLVNRAVGQVELVERGPTMAYPGAVGPRPTQSI